MTMLQQQLLPLRQLACPISVLWARRCVTHGYTITDIGGVTLSAHCHCAVSVSVMHSLCAYTFWIQSPRRRPRGRPPVPDFASSPSLSPATLLFVLLRWCPHYCFTAGRQCCGPCLWLQAGSPPAVHTDQGQGELMAMICHSWHTAGVSLQVSHTAQQGSVEHVCFHFAHMFTPQCHTAELENSLPHSWA